MRKILLLLIGCFFINTAAVANAAIPKQWTFLIYINGNNSLDRYGPVNIREMEQVGSTDQVNVVVQWASASAHKAVRLLVEKSTNPSRVTSPILEDLGLVDMGDYHTLQDFIKWGVEKFPAQHYFIDVWNHGSGWHLTELRGIKNPPKQTALSDISYDDISGNHITTEQLGKVMANAANVIGHKVDLYGSDACLMSMAEVANQMSDSVHYYVGSQDLEPAMGWPYGDLLKRWAAIPDATADDIAKILVDAYVKSYQGGSSGRAEVVFSAFDLDNLINFNQAIAKFGDNILQLNPSDRQKVNIAAKSSQSFMGDYGDVVDFITNIQLSHISGLDPENIAMLQKAVSTLVIANATTEHLKHAHGLSIWLPTYRSDYTEYAARYHGLEFDHNTHWGDVLGFLLHGATV